MHKVRDIRTMVPLRKRGLTEQGGRILNQWQGFISLLTLNVHD